MIDLRYPVNYVGITSGFRTKKRPNHTGIDLGWNSKYGGQNVPIYASANGKVVQIIDGKNNNQTNSLDAGNLVKIQHTDGITTRYIHLLKGSLKVKVGDIVYQGQEIAKMNNSGYSFGSHLHYDVWLNGIKVDPIKYTYIYEGQVVSSTTDKEFKILRIKDKPTKYVLTRLLKKGTKGTDVKELQKTLISKGYSVGKWGADGVFGADTLKAVKTFQKASKIAIDGLVGKNTANNLGWEYKPK